MRLCEFQTALVAVSLVAAFPASTAASDNSAAEIAGSYPQADEFLGEKLQAGEVEAAVEISKIISSAIQRKYAPGQARRDAHPKAHGCVRAKFTVHEDLDGTLSQGVFSPGKSYSAWIRFSNGDGDPNRPDFDGDGRGMAIKLLDIGADTLMPDDQGAKTQDFIMISHPVFLINDVKDYTSLINHVNSDSWFVRIFRPLLLPLDLGFRGLGIARDTTAKKIDNPLKTRYWSMVPYQLGVGEQRQAVKFSARPCSTHSHAVPEGAGKDFLRAAMRDTLATQDACMEFLVQPRTSASMSVEDSQTEWLEAEAPFHTMARIDIPKQEFDTPAQNEFCENLSYTPWHALPEHKPLGAVNRMRKVIYQHISRVRRDMNNVSPTDIQLRQEDPSPPADTSRLPR